MAEVADDTMRLLQQIHADFDLSRRECSPVSAQLVHRASNAKAEGVEGMPSANSETIAWRSAGHRELAQRVDSNGNVLFREDAIVDAAGQPIVNSAGQAFDVVMSATRSVAFFGSLSDYQRLDDLAERAGRILQLLRHLPALGLLSGWQFGNPADIWWAVLFEFAWSFDIPF